MIGTGSFSRSPLFAVLIFCSLTLASVPTAAGAQDQPAPAAGFAQSSEAGTEADGGGTVETPTATLTVVVIQGGDSEAAGMPLRAAEVTVSSVSDGAGLGQKVTGANGVVVFRGLPYRRVRVLAVKGEFESNATKVKLDSPAESARLTLKPVSPPEG